MSYSDSDSSSHGGDYKNFRQITREREFSLSICIGFHLIYISVLTLVDLD